MQFYHTSKLYKKKTQKEKKREKKDADYFIVGERIVKYFDCLKARFVLSVHFLDIKDTSKNKKQAFFRVQ